MAEVLVDFETPIAHGDRTYNARAVGRFSNHHMWEGWLEFLPIGGGEAVVSGVETTQPEREHLIYWATGLTPIYLEGALKRALSPTHVRVRVIEEPVSDAPAPASCTAPWSRQRRMPCSIRSKSAGEASTSCGRN
jgi:hypothetical protein